APLPRRDQRERKEQAEMWLVAEKPEADAGNDRLPLEKGERAADECGGEKAVLRGSDVPGNCRKAEREQITGALADDRAHGGEIKRQRRGEPQESRGQDRHQRERAGDEQEGRRIVPAVV